MFVPSCPQRIESFGSESTALPGRVAPSPPTWPRSCVYALGALAYFLLVGRSPFGGRGVVQVLAAHLHETPRVSCGQTHHQRCSRAREAPGDRYASADELAAALTAALEHGQQ